MPFSAIGPGWRCRGAEGATATPDFRTAVAKWNLRNRYPSDLLSKCLELKRTCIFFFLQFNVENGIRNKDEQPTVCIPLFLSVFQYIDP